MPAVAHTRILRPSIRVSSERIIPVNSARNIGVNFDQEMTLAEHVTLGI